MRAYLNVYFHVLVAIALVAVVFGSSGCSRSHSYKRDQAYSQGEEANTARKGDEKSISQVVEGMGQPKKRVVILDFWNNTPVGDEQVGAFAAEEMRRQLSTTSRLVIPDDVRTTINTQDLVDGEKVKVAQLVREGRRLGVAVIGIGRVSKIVFRQKGDEVGLLRQVQSIAAVDVEFKLFDIASGREILSTGRSADASSNSMVALDPDNMQSKEFRQELTELAVREAVTQLIPTTVRSVEKMSWEGKIVKISGSKAYINSGKSTGLNVGDILRVISNGEEVYDKSTGAYLGKAPGQLKGTLEVVDYLGIDATVAEIHSGGNFQEGDLVQLY